MILNATQTAVRLPYAALALESSACSRMVELAPSLCQHFANQGEIVVGTSDTAHEAGDLIQTGLDISQFPILAQIVRGEVAVNNKAPLLFKSCGWAGRDLAAAGLAVAAI